MIEKVRNTVKKYAMLDKGGTVIAAVSGGPDSMALLHTLYALKDELSLKIVVCHLNHNLRGGESRRDLAFVKAAAAELGLEFYGRTLKAGTVKRGLGESLQALARQRRIEFLEAALKRFGANRIALGHTMDDQAETVLMRLLKGASTRGLAGMRPVRDFFIRPLIEIERAAIMRYIEASGIDYIIDSSNLKTDYLRNDIRINLIPFIQERYNPNIIESLCRSAAALRNDDDFIEGIAEFVGVTVKCTRTYVVLDRLKLRDLHPALSTRAFLNAAGILDMRAHLSGTHIDAFMSVLSGNSPNVHVTLPDGLCVIREYDNIIISSRAPSAPLKPFDLKLKVPGVTVVRGTGYSFRASLVKAPPAAIKAPPREAYFDYSKIKGRLCLKQAAPGDRIAPLGMKGHKKLKDIFIDRKVPVRLRSRIPLVTAGKDLLWVPGLKRSGLHGIGPGTKKVLKLEFKRRRLRAF